MRRRRMRLEPLCIGISVQTSVGLHLKRFDKGIHVLLNKNKLVLAIFVLCCKGKVAQKTGLVLVNFFSLDFRCVEGLQMAEWLIGYEVPFLETKKKKSFGLQFGVCHPG